MKEESSRKLQELVAMAVVAGLGFYVLAHREITAAVDEMASQTAAVAMILAGAMRLGLHAAMAVVGAGAAARAVTSLLNRREDYR
jgi:hypothetical protein